MKALILNSGLGTRMGEITSDSPKCMVKLLGRETIISRQLHYLKRLGIRDIVITTGPYSTMLQEYCRSIQPDMQISYVQNPLYKTTNYIYSIYLAQNYLQEDVLLMHGDLVFEADVLQLLLSSEVSCMAVSTTQPLPQKDFKAVLEYEKGISYIRKIGIDFFTSAVTAQPLYKLYFSDWKIWLDQIKIYCKEMRRSVYAEEAFNDISYACNLIPIDIKDKLCGEIDTPDDRNNILKRLKEMNL